MNSAATACKCKFSVSILIFRPCTQYFLSTGVTSVPCKQTLTSVFQSDRSSASCQPRIVLCLFGINGFIAGFAKRIGFRGTLGSLRDLIVYAKVLQCSAVSVQVYKAGTRGGAQIRDMEIYSNPPLPLFRKILKGGWGPVKLLLGGECSVYLLHAINEHVSS